MTRCTYCDAPCEGVLDDYTDGSRGMMPLCKKCKQKYELWKLRK